jgi:hypothetical protein
MLGKPEPVRVTLAAVLLALTVMVFVLAPVLPSPAQAAAPAAVAMEHGTTGS